MTIELKVIKYKGVERTTRQWESIFGVTQNQMANIKAKRGWDGAIEYLLSEESKGYGKKSETMIEFMGQKKHRDLWADDFRVTINHINHMRDKLGSYVKALEFIASQRTETEKERVAGIMSGNKIFSIAMRALIPQGLTSNERVM